MTNEPTPGTEAEAPPKPDFLDLDSPGEDGPQVQLRGKLYDIKTPDQFSMEDSARIRRMVRQMQARLDTVDDLDIGEDTPEFKTALEVLDTEADRILRLVINIPDDIYNDLKTEQKMKILAFFTRLSWGSSTNSVISGISRQGSPSGTV